MALFSSQALLLPQYVVLQVQQTTCISLTLIALSHFIPLTSPYLHLCHLHPPSLLLT